MKRLMYVGMGMHAGLGSLLIWWSVKYEHFDPPCLEVYNLLVDVLYNGFA